MKDFSYDSVPFVQGNWVQTMEMSFVLRPKREHPAHVLWQRGLVLGDGIEKCADGHSAWICKECGSTLRRGKASRHSLANGLYGSERFHTN